jgi:hypothetical protein
MCPFKYVRFFAAFTIIIGKVTVTYLVSIGAFNAESNTVFKPEERYPYTQHLDVLG